MSDYVNVFPDRFIKLQSGKIKIYSQINNSTVKGTECYTEHIDTFDNKKQMKEWLQGYIKKQLKRGK